jgi:hypothetical protein
MSLSGRFIFVAAAAIAATAGDLLMLYVVETAQSDSIIVRPPGAALIVGGLLGAVGIPVYWFGYWLIAQSMVMNNLGGARVIVVCGVLIGSIGAMIHAVTAFAIRFDMVAGRAPMPPAEGVASWGAPLLVCWGIVTAAGIVAAIVMTRTALSSSSPIPRRVGFFNPVVLTIVLIGIGLGSATGRAYVVPAAPNIAHTLFFLLAAASADSFQQPARL